jgi:long-chain acyl-CoA synthetase
LPRVARNDPAIVGALIGILMSERSVAPFDPHKPSALLAEDVRAKRPAAVIACDQDWSKELQAAVRDIGAVGIRVDLTASPIVQPVQDLEHARYVVPPASANEACIERVTSGTTGTPKRIAVAADTLYRTLLNAVDTKSATADLQQLRVQASPTILLKPFAHAGGFWSLLMPLFHARPIVLFERFEANAWVDAVKRYKPRVAGLVPAMIKMVLDSDASAEDLASLRAVRSATAPLDPAVQQEFEERFGVPILVDYGASEFIGGLAGWSLRDHKAFAKLKRGSVGRPRADVSIRITDPDTSAEHPPGSIGVLELKADRYGADWIRTTDLASLDEDGFLYIHGRSDEAIIRGGFKVLPEKVAEVVRLHPNVNEACVLGVHDDRLGAVPVAFVEPRAGSPVQAQELEEFLRERLPPYQIPVAFQFLERLPRTLSSKVARPALRDLFASIYRFV